MKSDIVRSKTNLDNHNRINENAHLGSFTKSIPCLTANNEWLTGKAINPVSFSRN